MKKQQYRYIEEVTANGETVQAFRIDNDSNGNPRYVIHFLDLNIELADYDNINKLYGFKKYTAKWFGGGVVFQSYNIEDTVRWALETTQA